MPVSYVLYAIQSFDMLLAGQTLRRLYLVLGDPDTDWEPCIVLSSSLPLTSAVLPIRDVTTYYRCAVPALTIS